MLRGLIITVFLFALILAGGLWYLSNNHQIVIQEIEDWFEDNYEGQLSVSDIEVRLFDHFPSTVVEFKHIVVSDSLVALPPVVEVELLEVRFDALAALKEGLKLEDVSMVGSRLYLVTDQCGRSNSSAFRRRTKAKNELSWLDIQSYVAAELSIELQNSDVLIEEESYHRKLAFKLESLKGTIHFGTKELHAALETSALVHGLGFNLAKGQYLEKTPVQACLEVNYKGDSIVIPVFDLLVGEQQFRTTASIDVKSAASYKFTFFNEETDFQKTRQLLPAHLQDKLSGYSFLHPIETSSVLEGTFVRGDNPKLSLDFRTLRNNCRINNTILLESLTAHGNFTNRLNESEALQGREDRHNLKLRLDEFAGTYKGVQLHLQQSYYSSSRFVKNYVHLHGGVKGELKFLNEILHNDQFLFNTGRFSFLASMSGAINDLSDILKAAEGDLQINDAVVLYAPSSIEIPVEKLNLRLSPVEARIDNMCVPYTAEHRIYVSGRLINFSSLIFEGKTNPVRSQINIYAPELDLNQFLVAIKDSTRQQLDYSLTEVVKGIYHTFNPSLHVAVDKFKYEGSAAENIRTSLRFSDSLSLEVDELALDAEQNKLRLQGTMTLIPDSSAVRLQVGVSASGRVAQFNEWFDNETFFFQGGQYNFDGFVDGQIGSWEDFLSASSGHLGIFDSKVLIKPSLLSVTVERIDLQFDQQHAILNQLLVPLPSGSHIELHGELNHFPELLREQHSPLVKSKLLLRSPKIKYADFRRLFDVLDSSNPVAGNLTQNVMKSSLQDLYLKFHPSLSLQVDTFTHGDFICTAINSQVHFPNQDHLQFTKTGFQFKRKQVELDAEIGLSSDQQTPFDLWLRTRAFDLAALVETYDYFGLAALQETKRVEGKVSLEAHLNGNIEEGSGLQTKTLRGTVHFSVHEAMLEGFAPIQQIADKFFRTERLETIRFAPISETLFIANEVIHIPRMEIQSTAFNLFVEGHLNYDNNTNIWVSVPWKNFRSWEEGAIPEKTGYTESGGKLYVEVKGNDEGRVDYHLRLTNRRLYKHRGTLSTYRSDRRLERKARRAFRKKRRRHSGSGV